VHANLQKYIKLSRKEACRLSRFLYNVVLYLAFPLVMLRLFMRSIRQPEYRQRIRERLGWFTPCQNNEVIWIHAVSVGEVVAAAPLIRFLQQKYDRYQLLVTTTTPTGSAQLSKIFADSVSHVYAPYDLPGIVRRFLNNVHPALALIIETEIWPNLFCACKQRDIPLVMVNARLSARSAVGYRKVLPLTRQTLACISLLSAQNDTDAQRFIGLGIDESKVRVTGSIKFDLTLPAGLDEQARALRGQFGIDRPVWIAASTHEGEEELVIDAYMQMINVFADLLLILVPRHPERFERVAAICEKRKLKLVRRSSSRCCEADTRVYLGDTMGELMLLYAAADVAFVGGSLVSVGGHNLLEPAALGMATVTGPYMHNFEEITTRLLECSGVVQVNDSTQLAASIGMLLRDENTRKQMGDNAMAFVEANRGALAQLQDLIDDMLVAETQVNGAQE
jgi:3-deoxy-D-manno-octulosonic-acid transferase